MRENKRTPGSLVALPGGPVMRGYSQSHGLLAYPGGTTRLVAGLFCDIPGGEEEAAANARRLAACWNACEGIDDPAALRAQRDALREALVSIAEYWNGSANERAMRDACEHAEETARAALNALAKATP